MKRVNIYAPAFVERIIEIPDELYNRLKNEEETDMDYDFLVQLINDILPTYIDCNDLCGIEDAVTGEILAEY